MSPFKSLFNVYQKSLYMVIPFTTSVGFSAGLVENFTTNTTSLDVFTNMIGYTALGVSTGLFYPVTFPTILYEVLKN
jgi:hypothetical protein